jgi:hypothetical protein
MQWITFIGDSNLSLDSIKLIQHYGSISCHDVGETRFCVSYGVDHIYYDFVDESIQDYQPGDLDIVPYQHPHVIMMVYTSIDLMRRVIRQDNFLRNVYVDNGYDLIVPIEEFIRLGMPVEWTTPGHESMVM